MDLLGLVALSRIERGRIPFSSAAAKPLFLAHVADPSPESFAESPLAFALAKASRDSAVGVYHEEACSGYWLFPAGESLWRAVRYLRQELRDADGMPLATVTAIPLSFPTTSDYFNDAPELFEQLEDCNGRAQLTPFFWQRWDSVTEEFVDTIDQGDSDSARQHLLTLNRFFPLKENTRVYLSSARNYGAARRVLDLAEARYRA